MVQFVSWSNRWRPYWTPLQSVRTGRRSSSEGMQLTRQSSSVSIVNIRAHLVNLTMLCMLVYFHRASAYDSRETWCFQRCTGKAAERQYTKIVFLFIYFGYRTCAVHVCSLLETISHNDMGRGMWGKWSRQKSIRERGSDTQAPPTKRDCMCMHRKHCFIGHTRQEMDIRQQEAWG